MFGRSFLGSDSSTTGPLKDRPFLALQLQALEHLPVAHEHLIELNDAPSLDNLPEGLHFDIRDDIELTDGLKKLAVALERPDVLTGDLMTRQWVREMGDLTITMLILALAEAEPDTGVVVDRDFRVAFFSSSAYHEYRRSLGFVSKILPVRHAVGYAEPGCSCRDCRSARHFD